MASDDYNPEAELTVGELYGTRHPRNQLQNEDDFAFRVVRIDESADTVDVEFVVNGGRKLSTPEKDTVSYTEYQEALEQSSTFSHLA